MTEIDAVTGVKRVPVFFATNRLPADLAAKAFTGEFQKTITYGVATVTIPVHHKPGGLETPAWWNVFADKKDQPEYFTLSYVMALAQGEFAGQLEKAAQTPKPAELLIFLHGYNVTFEEAAMRAAQFAVDSGFGGIVVLFSWPSQGSLRGYWGDEERALSSGDVLAQFLCGLEKGPWPRVHLLAHSMGNRVLLLGLADNPRPQLPLGQLVFVAADVFVPMFDEKFGKLQNSGILPATSYASKADRALKISSKLHLGPRVGLVDQWPHTADHLQAIDATNVDAGFLGHGYWSAVPALLTDLEGLLVDGKSPQDRKLKSMGSYWTFPG
jgi:esterase/lipase superfamily enzyme